MAEAHALMQRQAGYRVRFQTRERGMLVSDHFPEQDEPPIADLEDAWKLAAQFAAVDPQRFVNVFVISALDWVPVDGYQSRRLNTYPVYEKV